MKALEEFKRHFANWYGLSAVCLTFDIDFAPDYMIGNVLETLDRHGARATFFATHQSCLLKDLEGDAHFEVGIHPYLGRNSSQGSNSQDIMRSLRRYYPRAESNRFHLLDHSYRDLAELGIQGIAQDVSSLRFNCPYLLPAWHADLNMVLLTYCWEDGICENARMRMSPENVNLGEPGVKIVNFHPMNIYLNGPDAQQRLRFKRDNPNLLETPAEVANRYRLYGNGAASVLDALLARFAERKVRLLHIRELAAAFRQQAKLGDQARFGETQGALGNPVCPNGPSLLR